MLGIVQLLIATLLLFGCAPKPAPARRAAKPPLAAPTLQGGIDGSGRLTIGGVPRFALGVYASGGGYSTDPNYFEQQFFSDAGWGLHDIPINVVLPYWYGNLPWDATRVMLDVLYSHGISFLLTGNAFEGGSWRRIPFAVAGESYVRQFAQHPAALGIYLADEPYDSLIPETEAHHRQVKAWAPNLVTFVALMAGYPSGHPTRTDPAMWVNAADILGVDPYPLYGKEPAAGYTHFVIADYVGKLRVAVPSSRPVWAVLQFFKGSSESRLPTPVEMRAHAVMAIVEGAQGIMWWDIGVGGIRQESAGTIAEYMGHLRALVQELAGLEPALLAENVNQYLQNSTRFPDPVAGRIAQLQRNVASEWLYSRIQWYQAELAALQAGDRSKSGMFLVDAANVRTRAMVANNRGYVFAYNYTNIPQPVTFNVPGVDLPGMGLRIWENKTGQGYAISGGASWSDTIEPYEAKIYVIGP